MPANPAPPGITGNTLLPRLSEWQETDEKRRVPGTREGVNGMLDYGYAILRTAVLRSLPRMDLSPPSASPTRRRPEVLRWPMT